jgi:predicted dehydrogenase
MKPIRLGVIGLGLIWIRTHKPMLAGLKDVFEPVAFCDTSEVRQAETAHEFPGAVTVADYENLLAMPDIEVVLILTPIALNAPMAMAAIKAGKHVIMEKPIARSIVEGRQLVAAAREAGLRLFVTEQAAYRRAETKLAELIRVGEIGELLMWDRVQHGELDPAKGALRYASTTWRVSPDFPLGPLFDGGVHVVASLAKVFGLPDTVFANGHQLRPEYGDYDQVTMTFHYANGLTGTLSHSSYLPPIHNYYYIYGSEGVILVEPNRIVIRKPDQSDLVIDLPAENSYANMWQALAQAYQSDQVPAYTPERALGDVATLLTVEQSIKTGRSLKLIQ